MKWSIDLLANSNSRLFNQKKCVTPVNCDCVNRTNVTRGIFQIEGMRERVVSEVTLHISSRADISVYIGLTTADIFQIRFEPGPI